MVWSQEYNGRRVNLIGERVPYKIVIKWTSELGDGHESLKYGFRNTNKKVLEEKKTFLKKYHFHIFTWNTIAKMIN